LLLQEGFARHQKGPVKAKTTKYVYAYVYDLRDRGRERERERENLSVCVRGDLIGRVVCILCAVLSAYCAITLCAITIRQF
jgi:hypothetical protein